VLGLQPLLLLVVPVGRLAMDEWRTMSCYALVVQSLLSVELQALEAAGSRHLSLLQIGAAAGRDGLLTAWPLIFPERLRRLQ